MMKQVVTSITISESQLVRMVMFNDKEESKLNSIISANNGAHPLKHEQIVKKNPFKILSFLWEA